MSRIFISHSTANNPAALAIAKWLEELGWGDYFLDISIDRGLLPGERWQQALRVAADRCEAVLFLISPAWRDSRWCLAEFLLAKQLGKPVFGVLVEPTSLDTLPKEMTAEWQLCDLVAGVERRTFVVAFDPVVPSTTVSLAEVGLSRLKLGLQRAGVGATTFEWPPPHDPHRSPYQGLKPLDVDDAAVFFGREAAIVRGLDALRRLRERGVEQMLVIVGASGAGKSSYLRAGLWPRLKRDDRYFLPIPVVRPGRAVLSGPAGLVVSLEAAFKQRGRRKNRADVLDALRHSGGLARQLKELQDSLLEALDAGPPTPTIVIPIDQGEELFANEGRAESEPFLALLRDALLSPNLDNSGERPGPVRPIALLALRSESLGHLQEEQQLASVGRVLFGLDPIPTGALKAVIEGPAERSTAAGRPLKTDPALTEQLLKDAVGADALPLLAFTLERLFLDYGADGELSLNDYEALGKVRGAIEAATEAAFSEPARVPAIPADTAEREQLLRRGFIPWLAVVDPYSEERRRRVARWEEIPPEARSLFERLIEARLLVRDRRPFGDGAIDVVVVEIAHEALLRQWQALTRWLDEESQALKMLEGARRAATEWAQHDRGEVWLVHGGQRLADAELLLKRPDFLRLLGADGADYVTACRSRETALLQERAAVRAERERARQQEIENAHSLAQAAVRLRRRARVAIALAIAATVVAIAAAVFKRSADRQAIAFRDSLAAASFREATIRVSENDNSGALAFLARTLRLEPRNSGARALALDLLLHRRWPLWVVTHGRYVQAVAWSPDGTRVVTGSDDGTVRVWDARSGQAVGAPFKHQGYVRAVAWSPDGTRVVTGSNDGTARVWDTRTGQAVGAPLQHQNEVYAVAWSPDSSRVVTGSDDKTARMWDARTGQAVGAPFKHQDFVRAVAWSPDGTRVVTGSDDGTARVWDAATGQAVGAPLPLQHQSRVGGVWSPNRVRAVAWSPDGTRVATGSWDGTVQMWDARIGQAVGVPFEHPSPLQAVAWTPDGTRLVTEVLDGTVRVWNARTGQAIGVPFEHHGCAALSPDGTRVVTGSDDGTVQMWDTGSGQVVGAPLHHQAAVIAVAWSPEGTRVVTGSEDTTARVWNARTGQAVSAPLQHRDFVYAVAWSPDGTRVVTGSGDETTARVWDAGTGQAVGAPLRHKDYVVAVAWSPDSTRVVTGSDDGTARVWDARTGQAVGAPLQHQDSVGAVAWSPDGTRVLTGSADGTARVWDAGTGLAVGAPFKHQARVGAVAWSPDGTRVVTGSNDGTARVWDARTGQAVGQPLQHQATVGAVAWSPDGTRVLTGSEDATARVWDAGTGQAVGEPLHHQRQVVAVAWSPDGTRLLTGSWDDTAAVWDARTGQAVGAPLQHQDSVGAVAWSPDGTRVLTGSDDGTARVWDTPLAESRDGERLAYVAELVGALRVTNDDAVESVADWPTRAARLEKVKKEVAGRTPEPGSLDALLGWFFRDPRDRAISPLSGLSIDEYVRRMLELGESGRAEVERNYPGHPALRSPAVSGKPTRN